MEKLSVMKIAKDAILSSIESSAKGGKNVTGANTSYSGPSAPTSITTYVDGMNWGSDGHVGRLFGDSWAIDKPTTASFAGRLDIKK